MSSRNGKNQPQLSPANVGHVAEAQRKADNRGTEAAGERKRGREAVLRSLCASALRCTFFAVPFCVFLRCCFAWPFAMYKKLHTSGRALSGAVSLCSFFLRSHSTPSLALSLFHTLSARCCCAAYASFFQASPIPSAFLTIFITQSLSLCQPVATTTTTTIECPSPCCCSCSCCFLGIAAFYAAK